MNSINPFSLVNCDFAFLLTSMGKWHEGGNDIYESPITKLKVQ